MKNAFIFMVIGYLLPITQSLLAKEIASEIDVALQFTDDIHGVNSKPSLEVVEDVYVDGIKVFAKGTSASYQLSSTKPKGYIGKEESIEMHFGYLRGADQQIYPLYGSVEASGQNKRDLAIGLSAGLFIVFPFSLLCLLIEGGQAIIKKGDVLTASTFYIKPVPVGNAGFLNKSGQTISIDQDKPIKDIFDTIVNIDWPKALSNIKNQSNDNLKFISDHSAVILMLMLKDLNATANAEFFDLKKIHGTADNKHLIAVMMSHVAVDILALQSIENRLFDDLTWKETYWKPSKVGIKFKDFANNSPLSTAMAAIQSTMNVNISQTEAPTAWNSASYGLFDIQIEATRHMFSGFEKIEDTYGLTKRGPDFWRIIELSTLAWLITDGSTHRKNAYLAALPHIDTDLYIGEIFHKIGEKTWDDANLKDNLYIQSMQTLLAKNYPH